MSRLDFRGKAEEAASLSHGRSLLPGASDQPFYRVIVVRNTNVAVKQRHRSAQFFRVRLRRRFSELIALSKLTLVRRTHDQAADASSEPPIAASVIRLVSSSVEWFVVVMPNGSCANASRLRTKTPRRPISQIATRKVTRFSVSDPNQHTISTAVVK